MNTTSPLPFGNNWAVRHHSGSALMDDFQRHNRPISDVWFKMKSKTSSMSTEIQIGGLSLIAVRSDPVCFNSVPDAQLTLVLPMDGSGIISDGVSSAHWTGGDQILRTSHQRSVEFAYDRMSIVTIRPDFAVLSREAKRLYPSFDKFMDRLKESGSTAFSSKYNGIDYSGLLLKLFKIIDDCGGDRVLLQRIRIDAAITRAIVMLIAQQTDQAEIQSPSRSLPHALSKVDIVCDHIQGSAGSPMTIGDMEEISGLSEQELDDAFRSRFNCSPQEWQRNSLLDRAHHLFSSRENTPSVKSVSYELGFSSVGSFSSHYRRRFGEFPSDTKSTVRRPGSH